MNHIYRSIWNEKTGTFVAVSENTKNGGKSASSRAGVVGGGFALKALAVSLLMAFGSNLYALPVDGVVAAGNATITSGAGSMTVNQSSQNVALNWQSFNIAKGEAVTFVQPNSSAIALNRVLGADPSSILGNLSANGKVFLVNPNGILFGQGASVNVGGLVASTLNISDSDFMAGRYQFAGSGSGTILNQGSINADGGYVALLGAHVSNQGTIAARLGTVALAAGNAITLDVAGDGFINVTVDQGAVNALVDNGGMIQADGGHVLLSAQAAGDLLHTVVNNTGIIQAQSVDERNGTIRLLGDMQSGTVNVAGKLDASAPAGGNGGFIDTSAAKVTVANDTKVTTAAAQGLTGSWLIDPTDYTIAATGGDITGALLSTNLAGTNITIQSISGSAGTAGDVNVNDVVSWSANKLTLNAQNNINIRANLNASASASLALEFGQSTVAAGNTSKVMTSAGAAVNLPPSTTNFTTKQGSDGAVKAYTVITSLGVAGSVTTTDLQGMNGNKALNYALGANIDATATSGWGGGAGFAPVGTFASKYFGTFDGLGHTISNLYVYRPATSYIGMFGVVGAGASVSNIGLANGSMGGASHVGGLIGSVHNALVSNSYATGTVNGSSGTGGLIGSVEGGLVRNSYASGAVTGSSTKVGGLIGSANDSSVSNSYATGAVNSNNTEVGGLLGSSGATTVSNSYATGAVTSNNNTDVGGLIGRASSGSVSNSYATGAVSGGSNVGGLVGNNYGSISNSYATGAVSGGSYVGGLVGNNNGAISNSYATGTVTGSGGFVGGLAGSHGTGTISNSYATGAVTGDSGVGGLVGGGAGYGYGTAEISNSYATGAVSGGTQVGGLLGDTGGRITVSNSFWDTTTSGQATSAGGIGMTTAQMRTPTNFASATAANGYVNPGWNLINTWVMYTGQTSPLLRSFMTALTVTAGNASKTYNGLAYSGGSVTYSTTPNMSNVLGSVSYIGTSQNAINAGSYVVTARGLYSNQQGYIISYVNGALTVNKANLTLSGTRSYDGTSTVAGSVLTATGVAGQTFAVTGAGDTSNLASKNVQTASTLANLTGLALGTSGNGGLTGNYNALSTNGSAINIGKANLTVSTTDVSKTYDGGLTAAGTATLTSGSLFGSDAISGGSFAYTDKNVGAGNKTVTTNGVTVTDGNSGGNYNVTYANNTTSTISQANLTLATSNVTKTYDGTLTATGTATVTSGTLFSGDTLSGGSFAYTDKNAGAGNKTVTTSGVTVADGNSGGNYNVTYANNTTSTINQAVLTATASASDKTYDGNTTAAATLSITSGLVGTETVTATGAGTFNTKDVATANLVTVNSTALADGSNGGLASNYSLAAGQTAAATIAAKALTATATAAGKTYDGNTTAAATLSIASGLVGTETVTATGAGTFNTKDVATANLVTVNSTALADGSNGGLASNYSLAAGQTAAATIVAKALTATGMSAANKVYDGNTVATLSGGTLSGLVGAETLGLAGHTGSFADKNVGMNKTMTVTGTTLTDGTGLASNYSIANPSGLVADITRLASVTWVGGASGNWFDPANWAGGAVPDLANVANVVIPVGVTVSFDNSSVVVPAQAGAVQVDSIGSDGSLQVVDGSLNVATSLRLASLAQSGGSIVSSGPVALGSFSQSGGTLAGSGDFTVTNNYQQTSSAGSVDMGGNVAITQTGGSTSLGNLATAGTLALTADNGDISQLAGTSIVAVASTLTAPNGTVALDAGGNDLGTVVISDGSVDPAPIDNVDNAANADNAGGSGDTRFAGALAGAVSMDGMNTAVDAADGPSATSNRDLRRLPAGASVSGILAGLNVTVSGQGIRLPPGVQPAGSDEDEK